MDTRSALVCAAIALAPFAARAQPIPDFSGKWKLNIDETEFPGKKPSAAQYNVVRTVEQRPRELRLKIERTLNGKKSGFDFVAIPIGGGEHVSDEAGIITARWRDATLHFDYLYNPGTERESSRTEDWTLSADRNTLIDQEWLRQADGRELRYRVVFDRQP
jgi:hypothetical protein